MADDADWAADMAEREREALIARHRLRIPPPARRGEPEPVLLDGAAEDVMTAAAVERADARVAR
jgi:hypothetical protein